MHTRRIWKKTEKGVEEMRSRATGLASHLRRVLILVDGISDEQKVLQKGAPLPDDVPAGLRELAVQGYIYEETALTIAEAKAELIRIAQETLGADASSVVERIRTAPDTKEGLQSVIGRCKKIVKMVINENLADSLVQQCTRVLSEIP